MSDSNTPLLRRQSTSTVTTAPANAGPPSPSEPAQPWPAQPGLFEPGPVMAPAHVRRVRPRALRVLLVEDSHDDAWLVQRQLDKGGFMPEILRVTDAEGLRGALKGGRWDIVIADYHLPSMSGLDAVRMVRQHCTNLPCLLVSGTVGETVAVEAMRLGANDYLMKGNLTRLVPAVERELRESESRSERRRAERALAASEERTRLIIEHALDAVVSFTAQGQVPEWNLRAEELFGRSRVEVIGRPFDEVVLAPPARQAFTQALVDGFPASSPLGIKRRAEVVGEHCDGRMLALELSLVPVPSSAGLSYSGFLRDLSERREGEAKRASLEAQLRQSQKMEAIGKLAGGVAHDFNNLLTVIQGQSALLEDGLLEVGEIVPAARAIGEAADKAAELTRQLLAFSRRQVVQLVPTDVNELVADLGKLLRRLIGADIALHTVLAPGRVHINADAGMIEQVLMNLAVNARDAMPSGGALVVSTSIVHARPPRTATAAPGPGTYARLTVRDSGTGIDAEHLPHIFEPFYTTKDKARSTGLGLATVFGIVEQHRGWVEVHTKVGEGTVFDVYVPQCADSATETPAMASAPAPLPRGHECVLVVEDEFAVRDMVRDVLVRQGYRVYEAGSGREALDLWSRHRSEIDLVLTDIVMPDGIMGTDLVQRLMSDRPDLPVIFTSGYSHESDRVDVELVDGVNFLQKPYRPAMLVRLLRERLELRRG